MGEGCVPINSRTRESALGFAKNTLWEADELEAQCLQVPGPLERTDARSYTWRERRTQGLLPNWRTGQRPAGEQRGSQSKPSLA